MNKIEILYEDKYLIVIYKPIGMDAQRSFSLEQDVESFLKNYFYTKGLSTYLGLIHRLDKNVSGIMVLGKTKEATKLLNKDFQYRKLIKKYLAVVCGKPEKECGKLLDYLKKDVKTKKAMLSKKEDKDAKLARLSYKKLSSFSFENKDLSILDIELDTGRFHQIRAQLSKINLPILGDKKYYKEDINIKLIDKGIMLHSYYLEFSHPITKKKLSIKNLPEWNLLKNLEIKLEI